MEVRKQKGVAVVHVGNHRAGAGTGLGCCTLLDDFHTHTPTPRRRQTTSNISPPPHSQLILLNYE